MATRYGVTASDRWRTQNVSSAPPDDNVTGERPDSESAVPAVVPEDQEDDFTRIAKMLPPEGREMLVQILHATSSHSGPLPTPETLAKYEAILPGLAERIVRLPEREQEHRHEFSKTWLRREARLRDRGQIFGMVALLVVLAFCTALLLNGFATIAGAVAIALVIGVVGIFVTGRVVDARTPAESADPEG